MKYFKFLREPFVLIILSGIILWFAYYTMFDYLNRDKNIVVVTSNEIMQMEQSWQSRWNRPPTPKEREGLINQHIREIVLYRTALEMGLDKDDRVIRGRMVQKLEFLGNDLIRPPNLQNRILLHFMRNTSNNTSPMR